jgi:aquaporin Z
VMTILGATDKRAPQGFAGIPIGLMLMLIHLVSIPVTNTSVNPARTTGPAIVVAIFGKAEMLAQVWLFWLAPIIGAVLAGYLYLNVFEENAGNVTE